MLIESPQRNESHLAYALVPVNNKHALNANESNTELWIKNNQSVSVYVVLLYEALENTGE